MNKYIVLCLIALVLLLSSCEKTPLPISVKDMYTLEEIREKGWSCDVWDDNTFFDPILDTDTLRVTFSKRGENLRIEFNKPAYVFACHAERWPEKWPDEKDVYVFMPVCSDAEALVFTGHTVKITEDFLSIQHHIDYVLLHCHADADVLNTRYIYLDLCRYPGGDRARFMEQDWSFATIEVRLEARDEM